MYFLEGLSLSQELINDLIFMCETRIKGTYFTRIGRNKMDFKSIIIFILNFVKKSLQLELDDFFGGVYSKDINVTKQAFSKARQKMTLPTGDGSDLGDVSVGIMAINSV